jgi:site-specific recombinase XerD
VRETPPVRVPDVDFAANQLVVRGGKGDRDRVTMLPAVAKADLARYLEPIRAQHHDDLAIGAGRISSARSGW